MGTGQGTDDESAFASAIKAGRFPSGAILEALEQVAAAHTEQHAMLRTAIDAAMDVHRPRLAEALRGAAGDAQLAAHDANKRLWDRHADLYPPSADAVVNAVGELRDLQNDLNLLIQDKEPQYDSALRRRDVVGAQQILADAHTEANSMVADRGSRAQGHIQSVNFTAPIPQHPVTDPDGKNGDHGKQKRHKQTDLELKPSDEELANGGAPPHDKNTPIDDGTDPLGTNEPTSSLRDKQTDIPAVVGPSPPQMPFPGTQMGTGGGSGSSAGGLTGLGSSLRPSAPSLGSVAGASAGTSPASVMPQVPSGASGLSSASPLANAGSSFQSGLASGMGVSGGMGPAVPTSSTQPLQPFVSQQPAVATPAGAISPAGVPVGSADSVGLSSGHGAGSAGPGGGAAMMPPAGMAAAQPLAPYSAPGSGAGSGISGTAPAGSGGAGQSAPAGGAGSAGGGPGAPTVMAGNPGSSAAMSALAGSSTDVNPDLLTAQRVLAGLVRGSEESSALVVWAVGVLRSSLGLHIVVASNIGGGWYLPPKVFLPTTVRLAVNDPSLPMGWADAWMGCQKPSKIIVDYFSRLRKVVAGISVSAIVTTELWPEPSRDCGGDFLGMQHKDLLNVLSEAPKLDAAQQHRLTVIDPGLAQQIIGIDCGGDVSAWAAATLTGAVFREATSPDGTGLPLVQRADADMLQAVNDGTANAEMWATYDCEADQRDNGAVMWPDTHAPLDNDGSEAARAVILWYTHYYRMGRMIELVRCWKARPPRLAEIAYCGITGGFGPVVVSTLAAMEQHLARKS